MIAIATCDHYPEHLMKRTKLRLNFRGAWIIEENLAEATVLTNFEIGQPLYCQSLNLVWKLIQKVILLFQFECFKNFIWFGMSFPLFQKVGEKIRYYRKSSVSAHLSPWSSRENPLFHHTLAKRTNHSMNMNIEEILWTYPIKATKEFIALRDCAREGRFGNLILSIRKIVLP